MSALIISRMFMITTMIKCECASLLHGSNDGFFYLSYTFWNGKDDAGYYMRVGGLGNFGYHFMIVPFIYFSLTTLFPTANTMLALQYVYNMSINTRVLILSQISFLCSNIYCATMCQVYFTTWIPRSHFKLLCPKQNTEFMLPPFKFYPTRKLILLYCHPTASPAKTWASSQGGLFHFHLLFRTCTKPVIFTSKTYFQTRHLFFLLLFFHPATCLSGWWPCRMVLAYLLSFHRVCITSFHQSCSNWLL